MPETSDRPRLMTKVDAVAYCNVTPAGFSLWVKKSIVPGPIPGTRRHNRAALDRALDKLFGITSAPESPESGLEKFRRERKRLDALKPETPIEKIRREQLERARAKNAGKAAQEKP